MLGKTHLLLAALLFLPLAYAFADQGYITAAGAALFLFGTLLGVLIPDSDAVDSRMLHRQSSGLLGAYAKIDSRAASTPFQIVGYVTRYLFYEPIAFFVRLAGHSQAAKHRGFMHSLAGVALTSAFWAIIFNAFSYFNILPLAITSLVLEGMVGGALLHLYHDSLTPSGVNWLFPFSGSVRGRIKTVGRGLRGSTKLHDSQALVIGLFVIVAMAITWLAVIGKVNAIFLSFLSGFTLLLVAFVCGLESPEARGLLEWSE
jgi:membrane-bound metal-dependent hydrolase YbcI (DUF457 family)